MNIAKNMEAIFVAAIVIASATSFATAAVEAPAVIAVKAEATTMPTVTVTAKRLTAEEKAAL
ncbi:hypothetical protein GJ697_03010 [Pseudoduganella sp. FT25W]|jgi:hypothetical protein|uniref:Uncharacterized protein n=1 Tax=Duganella alba TaxID=2666081 RepID=A0A6L5QB97_9BURK|nr:hypothetical protein [Duganella alba]MRX06798.1 hypothetical protein [Duganella alba]MRX18399.1 hypothetical protein [Duganella alba]